MFMFLFEHNIESSTFLFGVNEFYYLISYGYTLSDTL